MKYGFLTDDDIYNEIKHGKDDEFTVLHLNKDLNGISLYKAMNDEISLYSDSQTVFKPVADVIDDKCIAELCNYLASEYEIISVYKYIVESIESTKHLAKNVIDTFNINEFREIRGWYRNGYELFFVAEGGNSFIISIFRNTVNKNNTVFVVWNTDEEKLSRNATSYDCDRRIATKHFIFNIDKHYDKLDSDDMKDIGEISARYFNYARVKTEEKE